MTAPPRVSSRAAELRRSAEQRLKAKTAATPLPLPLAPEDALELLHELQVHQIELEMQNEELRHARDELEASRDRYGMLYDFAPIGYFTLGRDGAIRTANLAGAALLGTGRARLIGRRFPLFVAATDRAAFADYFSQAFSGRQVQSCEVALAGGDGGPAVVQMEAALSGSGEECLVAVIDVSARKRAEEALRRLGGELEHKVAERTSELASSLERLKEEMAGRLEAVEELRKNEMLMIQQNRLAAMGEMLVNIAHQWRQPLNLLGLKVQEIGLTYELGGFSKELLDANVARAMDIVQHLSRTIDDFRDFSGPDKQNSQFSLNEALAKTVFLIRDNFSALGIAIKTDARGEPRIDGYPSQFSQVILNILANAKDAFLENRTEEPRITVRSWWEAGRAVVTITDNAGGIAEEILDKIFAPYFTTKELGKGTGIGLFMSKAIIEKNMRGQLTVRNVEGGAQFRIEV